MSDEQRFEAWATLRFRGRRLSTKTDDRAIESAIDLAREGWDAARARATPTKQSLTDKQLNDIYSFARGECRQEWLAHMREYFATSATPADPNAKMLSMRPTPEIIAAMVQYGMTEKQAREAYAVVMCSVPSDTPADHSVLAAIPKGWKLVPIKPTWEMIAKGSLLALGRNMNEATVESVWTGMLSVVSEPKGDGND